MNNKKKAKLISFIIIVSIIILPVQVNADISNGEILRELGILKGNLSGNLLLEQPLKRQDGIIILSRLLGQEKEAKNYNGSSSFLDIKNPYYEPYIAWAEDKGLTEGISKGVFGYDLFLTKQQIVAFMLRALGYEYYGEKYYEVPTKAIEENIIENIDNIKSEANREYMADVTFNTLVKGKMKYSHITLERSLAINDDRINQTSQIFSLKAVSIKNGYMLVVFNSPTIKENDTTAQLLNNIIKQGPDVDDLQLMYTLQGKKKEIILNKVLYDQPTRQMVVTFEKIDIPQDEVIDINVNYFENRKHVAHEAAHVMQQREGVASAINNDINLIDTLLEETIKNYVGTFNKEQFDIGTLSTLKQQIKDKIYNQQINSAVIYKEKDNKVNINAKVVLEDNVIKPTLDNFFIHLYINNQRIEINSTVNLNKNNINININQIQLLPKEKTIMFFSYINNDNMFNKLEEGYGFTKSESKNIIDAFLQVIQQSLNTKGQTHSINYGNLTISNKDLK